MKDLWVSVSGALAQQKLVDTIANNVANSNTPGFKRDNIVFKEYLTALERGDNIPLPTKEWSPDEMYRTQGAEKAFVKTDRSYVDHTQGSLSLTNNPFDLALNGKGFFEVLTTNGIRYTRQGSFSISPDNFLVNSKGHHILSKQEIIPTTESNQERNITSISPEQRKIKVTGGKIYVNKVGEVFIKNKKIGNISIIEFKDTDIVKKEGNSYFINNDINNIKSNNETTTKIYQGFSEGSNVNALAEMAKLIKANRQLESIQKIIKAYDNIEGKAINEISKF